jgi:hypothetical protein
VGALTKIYRGPQKLVGVDIFEPYLSFCRKLGIYNEVIKHDLRIFPYPFQKDEFDIAIALEIIEHLPKDDAIKMLSELERVARRVIISTPNIFFGQRTYDANPFQRHLSRVSTQDFKVRGYRVFGVGSLLIFGKTIPYISYALGRVTLLFPQFSTSLLAIKDRTKLRV